MQAAVGSHCVDCAKAARPDVATRVKFASSRVLTPVTYGIIAVNVWAAQEICDLMTQGGIKALWNFAPLHLQAGPDVLVRHEDFAGSLAVISHYLRSTPPRKPG